MNRKRKVMSVLRIIEMKRHRMWICLQQLPKPAHVVIGLVAVLLVEWLDYLTGPEVLLTLFYFIPIAYFAWFLGLRAGLIFSVLGAFLSVFTDVLFLGHHYSNGLIPWFNFFARFGVFGLMLFMLVRLQEELNKQVENIREIKKLSDAKSEFVASVSHELRTPLTAIKENLAIVHDGSVGALTAKQKDFLGTVKRNIDRLSRLIGDILDFQYLDYGRMPFQLRAADLNQLIREVEANYRPAAVNKKLELKSDLEPKLPFITMDRERMHQVLANLLQNAIRYSDHGTITLRTRLSDGKVFLSVEDQGRGILAKEMPKLFQSFQRLSSSVGSHSEGTGLGLAISKKIVEAHQGTIEAFSKKGEGTIFKISLKLSSH